MKIDSGELQEYLLQEGNGERHDGRIVVDVIHDPTSITQLNNQIMSLSYTFIVPAYPPEEERIISFSTQELAVTPKHGTQPVVITISPGNNILKRVLVDSGASRNILNYEVFLKMKLKLSRPESQVISKVITAPTIALGIAHTHFENKIIF